jgi:hypothetical protein
MPPRSKPKHRDSLPVAVKDEKTLAKRPVMILVLGPHRSGTSLTTRMLECIGAQNSARLLPPEPCNPKGFFEDLDIYRFNESILFPAVRQWWGNSKTTDWTVLSKTDRSRLALQALEIVRRNYPTTRPLSVLKDPRINNTLPFWLSLLEHAGFDVCAVCVVRDPISMAKSLANRSRFSHTRSGMLYLSSWLSALPHLLDRRTAFVHFDEIFASPANVLRNIARILTLPLPEDFEQRVHNFTSTHIDPSLRHSSVHHNDVQLEPDFPAPVIDLYRVLLDAAQSQNVTKTAKFLSRAETLIASINPLLSDYDSTNAAADAARAEVEALRHQQELLQAELAATRQSDHEALSIERSALDSRLSALTAEHSELATRHTSLVTSHEELVTERDALAARVSFVESENSDLAARHSSLATALEELQGHYSTLEAKLSALMSERSDLASRQQQLARELQALCTEHSSLSTLHFSVVAERDELAARHQSLVKDRDDLATCKQQLATALDEMRQQTSSLVRLQETLEIERQALQQESDRAQSLATRLSDLQSEHFALVASHSSIVASNEDLAMRHSSAVIERNELYGKVATRDSELASCANIIVSQHYELEETRGMWSSRAAGIGSVRILDAVDSGRYQHLNIMLCNIQSWDRDFPHVKVRLLDHHGNLGIAVFAPSESSVPPIRRWTMSGEENSHPYMLLFPDSDEGRRFLCGALASDYNFIDTTASLIARSLSTMLKRGHNTPERVSSLNRWLHVVRALLSAIHDIPAQIHYDHVSFGQETSPQATDVSITLNPVVYKSIYLSTFSLLWKPQTSKNDFSYIFTKDEAPPCYSGDSIVRDATEFHGTLVWQPRIIRKLLAHFGGTDRRNTIPAQYKELLETATAELPNLLTHAPTGALAATHLTSGKFRTSAISIRKGLRTGNYQLVLRPALTETPALTGQA